MNTRSILVSISVLGLAACATTPQARFASSVKAAQAAQRPLLVYQFLSGPTMIYYKNRNRYHGLAYADHVKIFSKFTAVSFINTASQTIKQVTFELAAYSDVYRPVLRPNGRPVVKQLVADGPFAPGVKQTLVNANVVWALPPGNGLGCVRLSGMRIVYADGSSATVSVAEVEKYFSPQLANRCDIPPRNGPGVDSGWAGPSPFVAGVYPAKWMILREYQSLYRQPFVPPSNTQPLCAVGSLLEETCGFASNSSDTAGLP